MGPGQEEGYEELPKPFGAKRTSTYSHMLDILLQDLVSALLGFGVALPNLSLSSFYFF